MPSSHLCSHPPSLKVSLASSSAQKHIRPHVQSLMHLCLEKKKKIFSFCVHVNMHPLHCGTTDTPGQHLLSRQHPPHQKMQNPTHQPTPQNTLNRKGDEFCALPAFRHACFHIHVKDTLSITQATEDHVSAYEDRVRELPLLLNEHVGRLVHPPAAHASLFLLPPLHFYLFNTAVQYLLTALRIHESPSLVPVVAPKRQLASLPPPSYLPVPPSACQFLSPFIPPFFLDWLSSRRSFSLPQYSVCLLPKLSHCQAHDIISLPFMGNSGLP